MYKNFFYQAIEKLFYICTVVIVIVPDTSLMRQPKYIPLSAGRPTSSKPCPQAGGGRFSQRDGYAKREVPRIGTE